MKAKSTGSYNSLSAIDPTWLAYQSSTAFALFKSYLERHSKELRMPDVSVAAFVCVTSIEAVAHTAVLHHAGTISDNKIETLIDETTRLIVGYLK